MPTEGALEAALVTVVVPETVVVKVDVEALAPRVDNR